MKLILLLLLNNKGLETTNPYMHFPKFIVPEKETNQKKFSYG